VKSTPVRGVKECLKPRARGPSEPSSGGDGVLFVERTGERSRAARLRQRQPEPQRKRVRTGRGVARGKPETG